MKAPKGFEGAEARRLLAQDLCRQIQAYEVSRSQLKARWDEVMSVYDDDPDAVATSFSWPKYVSRPYNVALIQTRVDALVADVVGGIMEATPLFINRGAPSSVPSGYPIGTKPSQKSPDDVREDVEQTIDYALRVAGLERRARDAAYEAVLKGRGVLRVRYVESLRNDDAENIDVALSTDHPELQYSGLQIDAFTLEDAVFYPFWCEQIEDCTTVGFRFYQSVERIRSRQSAGMYFQDIDLTESGDTDGYTVDKPGEAGKLCYELYTLASPEDLGLPAQGKKAKRRWYRAVLAYQDEELLALEIWDEPRIPMFAPAFRLEPNRVLPKRSIAAKALEMQALMNDLSTAAVVGTVNTAFTNAVVTGMLQTEGNIELGLNEMLPLESNTAQVTPLQSRFQMGAIPFLMQFVERTTDGIFRISAMGMGQQMSSNRTATEVSGALAGQDRGLTEYRVTFGYELEKMADYARYLIAKNYVSFKAFHGGNVKCESASELLQPARFEIFGRSSSSSPQATLQKLQMMMGMAQQLGIPLDPQKIFEVGVNMLDLPVNVAKLLQEPTPVQPGMPGRGGPPMPLMNGVPGVPGMPQTHMPMPAESMAQGPMQAPAGMPPEFANLPPEVLAQLISGQIQP